MSLTEHSSTLFIISFLKHMVQNPLLRCQYNLCQHICKWKRAIIVCFVCCIDTLIPYGVTYIRLMYFILSIIWSNKISTDFITITAIVFVFFKCCFCEFNSIYYFKNIKSLIESYWPFIYIINHFLFKHLIQNWLSTVTETVVTPVVSDKEQQLFVLFVALINSYFYSDDYISLAYFLLSIMFWKKYLLILSLSHKESIFKF